MGIVTGPGHRALPRRAGVGRVGQTRACGEAEVQSVSGLAKGPPKLVDWLAGRVLGMIGTGYVGLVSGARFSDFGHVVTCIDKDPSKIQRLELGEIPIFEPGLDDLVARNVREGRLFFTLEGAVAIKNADMVFIAVGTPTRRGYDHADLSYFYVAAEEIAGLIDVFTLFVTKSTVPVGTGGEVEAIIKRTNLNAQFAVVSNIEFLREGAAIEDFKRPDRVVGAPSASAPRR